MFSSEDPKSHCKLFNFVCDCQTREQCGEDAMDAQVRYLA